MSDDIDDLEAELDETDTSKSSKRLKPHEWAQIRRIWAQGTHSLQQIADQFDVRKDTLQKRLKQDGIEKGSRAHEITETIDSSVEEEMARQAAENTRRINDTKNNHYLFAEALAKLAMNEVMTAKNERRAFSTIDGNITALNKTAKTLEILRKERYALLGLDREDGDPEDMDELIISELSEDQIAKLQAEMRGLESPNSVDDMFELDDGDSDIIEETGED